MPSSKIPNDIVVMARLCKKLNQLERELAESRGENKLLRQQLSLERTWKEDESMEITSTPRKEVVDAVPTVVTPEGPTMIASMSIDSEEGYSDPQANDYQSKYEQSRKENERLRQAMQEMQANMEHLQVLNTEYKSKIEALESFFYSLNAESHRLLEQADT